MSKWLKFFILCIIVIIIVVFFQKFTKINYKSEEKGNNKNIQEIEEYFLKQNSYNAKLEVTVKSNKNVNYYKIEQSVNLPKEVKQVITSPEDVAGIELIYKEGKLEIRNSKYNLSKIYKDYPYISSNNLFLTSFLEGYKNAKEKEIKEVEGKVEMEYKSNINKFNAKQKLYINKSTLKPETLDIFDINNNAKINIIYNEIEFK